MSRQESKLLPAELPRSAPVRRQLIVDWWMGLERSGDAGATTWEVLDVLRDQVTYALMKGAASLVEAESLTAQAMLLVAGLAEC